MKTLLIAASLSLLSVVPVSAQLLFSSEDGGRTVAAYEDGSFVYRSANGTLKAKVSKTKLQMGAISIEASDVFRTANGVSLRITVRNGATSVSDVVQFNDAMKTVSGSRLPQLRNVFSDIARSPEGHLWNEARELIVQNLRSDRSGAASRPGLSSEWRNVWLRGRSLERGCRRLGHGCRMRRGRLVVRQRRCLVRLFSHSAGDGR